MRSQIILALIGAVAFVSAQSATPKPLAPTKSSFTELTAYNIAGYTPQQLWGWRSNERIVKFDTGMDCIFEHFKSYGNDQKTDAYCWRKDVHWNVNSKPQCSQGLPAYASFNVDNSVALMWSYYNAFTVYEGQVADPFYSTGLTYHRAKHPQYNKWIWYRTTDRAIVYEQYWDGSSNSFVKYFEGGIVENRYLFTSDFRIPKCSNPFVSLPTVSDYKPSLSFFNRIAETPVSLNANETVASNETVAKNETTPVVHPDINDIERWLFETYDVNGNGKLSIAETRDLVRDLNRWYLGEEQVTMDEFEKWFSDYDFDKDGELSIDEIFRAISI